MSVLTNTVTSPPFLQKPAFRLCSCPASLSHVCLVLDPFQIVSAGRAVSSQCKKKKNLGRMVCYIAWPGSVIRVARSLLFFVVFFKTLVSLSSHFHLLKRLVLSRLVKPPLMGAPPGVGQVGWVK